MSAAIFVIVLVFFIHLLVAAAGSDGGDSEATQRQARAKKPHGCIHPSDHTSHPGVGGGAQAAEPSAADDFSDEAFHTSPRRRDYSSPTLDGWPVASNDSESFRASSRIDPSVLDYLAPATVDALAMSGNDFFQSPHELHADGALHHDQHSDWSPHAHDRYHEHDSLQHDHHIDHSHHHDHHSDWSHQEHHHHHDWSSSWDSSSSHDRWS